MLNTVKTLTAINKIIETLPEEDQRFINKALTEEIDYTQIIATAPAFIIQLKKECLSDIKHSAAKTNGTAAALKAGERVLKSMEKSGCVAGAYGYNGMQVICDGFHAALLKEALPLRELPENAYKMDIKPVIDDTQQNKGDALKVPTAAEIKSYIKIYKSEHPDYKKSFNKCIVYEFTDGPRVNAEYLLDIVEMLGDSVKIIPSIKSVNKTLYCESAAGIGLLCPIFKRPENDN